MATVYDGVPVNHPSLNRFDLSYTHIFSAKMGLLYVAQCDTCVPGDVFKMKAFCDTTLQPLVAPIKSDINIFAHTFFVPYRLLFGVDSTDGENIWEKFITGGKDGTYTTALPAWTPSWSVTGFSSGMIWDSVGNPCKYVSSTQTWTPLVPANKPVFSAPKRAYNLIYNKYFMDENLQEEVDLNSNEALLPVSFKKDYFTSCMNSQQRGETPALPVDITGSYSFTGSGITWNQTTHTGSVSNPYSVPKLTPFSTSASNASVKFSGSSTVSSETTTYTYNGVPTGSVTGDVTATSFDIADLRLAFAIQRMQEISMTGGYRYTEWLHSMFGCNPTDARLDRPEYIGGCMIPVNIGTCVQTGMTPTSGGTPQGNKSGTGSANSIEKIGNYRVLEHGLIMTVISIVPKPIYKYGVNRQWLITDKESIYNPCTAYLSEQAVYNCELYTDPTSVQNSDNNNLDSDIFGYQAHWNEMRAKENIVSGAVREQFDYWTLARPFGSRPHLNADFIKVVDSDFNHAFAVQDEDEFIVSWTNLIDAYRPVPAVGVPGLIDHVYGGR